METISQIMFCQPWHQQLNVKIIDHNIRSKFKTFNLNLIDIHLIFGYSGIRKCLMNYYLLGIFEATVNILQSNEMRKNERTNITRAFQTKTKTSHF